MTKLAAGRRGATRQRASGFIVPLGATCATCACRCGREPVTRDDLPPELRAHWSTPDGRARVEVAPAGDPNNNDAMRRFARAVLAVEPHATGGPISILESGRHHRARVHRGRRLGAGSIAILLWLVLRRVGDVLLTLVRCCSPAS